MKEEIINWKLNKVPVWVITNKTEGILNPKESNNERIQISIDWNKWNKNISKNAQFTINYGDKVKVVNLNVNTNSADIPAKFFMVMEDRVVIYAQNFTSIHNKKQYKWIKMDGLGYCKAVMQAEPTNAKPLEIDNLEKEAPYLEYKIQITDSNYQDSELILHAIPTLPMTNKHGVRIGVKWNNSPIQIVDFKTYDRSEEWKQNVLSNTATKKIALKSIPNGTNTLRIFRIDEGVLLDNFYINLNKNNPVPYSLLPETIK